MQISVIAIMSTKAIAKANFNISKLYIYKSYIALHKLFNVIC